MRTNRPTTTAIEPGTETRSETGIETETRQKSEPGSDPGSPATIAELAIPAAEFALGDTLATLDGVAFEIERVVAHGTGHLTPLVWASGERRKAIEPALRGDSSVMEFELLADVGEQSNAECLYRMDWSERIEGIVRLLTAENGTLLAGSATGGRWHLRVLVPERPALARAHEACGRIGVTVDPIRIYALEDGRRGGFGLTDAQREALALAFEQGYYGVPRDTTTTEFAEELGISHQALSERLRRAHGNLVENAVVAGRDTGD